MQTIANAFVRRRRRWDKSGTNNLERSRINNVFIQRRRRWWSNHVHAKSTPIGDWQISCGSDETVASKFTWTVGAVGQFLHRKLPVCRVHTATLFSSVLVYTFRCWYFIFRGGELSVRLQQSNETDAFKWLSRKYSVTRPIKSELNPFRAQFKLA